MHDLFRQDLESMAQGLAFLKGNFGNTSKNDEKRLQLMSQKNMMDSRNINTLSDHSICWDTDGILQELE